MARSDPQFVARLAVYTREQLYLRSVPLVLAVELARIHRGDNLVTAVTHRLRLGFTKTLSLLQKRPFPDSAPK